MACIDAKYGIGQFGISRYGTLCPSVGLIYSDMGGIFQKKLDGYSDTPGRFLKKNDAYSNASGIYKKKLRA